MPRYSDAALRGARQSVRENDARAQRDGVSWAKDRGWREGATGGLGQRLVQTCRIKADGSCRAQIPYENKHSFLRFFETCAIPCAFTAEEPRCLSFLLDTMRPSLCVFKRILCVFTQGSVLSSSRKEALSAR
eukprot:6212651-Pleurochrysis_carterae.AAC.1